MRSSQLCLVAQHTRPQSDGWGLRNTAYVAQDIAFGSVRGVVWRSNWQAMPTAQIMGPYLGAAVLLHMVLLALLKHQQVADALRVAMQAVESRYCMPVQA
jgi:hypothetical protein